MHVTSVHTKEKPYKCHLCSVGFPRKDSLTRHIKGVHNKEGKGNSSTNPAINVKIERAEAAEAGRETIYTTVNPIPNNIQYSVKQEAYEMNSAPPATDFLQIQHNSEGDDSKSFKCHLCGYQTSRKSDHNRHLMSVHSQKPPVEKEKHLKCDKCSYATHRRGDLNRHLVNVHTEAGKNKVKDFKCDHCEYATTRRSDLERHVSGIHFRYGRYTQAAAENAQQQQTEQQQQIQGVQQQQIQVQTSNQTNHVIDVKPVHQIQVQHIPTLPTQPQVLQPPVLPTQPIPPSQINVQSVQHHPSQPQTQQQPYHIYQQR